MMGRSVSWAIGFALFVPLLNSCRSPFDLTSGSRISVINNGDSSIRFSLINPDKKINPKSGSNYFWFRSGKIHRTEGEFAGKLLDGDYDLFGPDSELFQKGQYRNGRRKGKWKSWYSNGALASIIIYKKGNQSGRAIFFEKKGKLRLSSKFSHGKKNGREKEFKNGVKSAIRRYNDGDLVWEKIIVF